MMANAMQQPSQDTLIKAQTKREREAHRRNRWHRYARLSAGSRIDNFWERASIMGGQVKDHEALLAT
jgi:hypothetical protein